MFRNTHIGVFSNILNERKCHTPKLVQNSPPFDAAYVFQPRLADVDIGSASCRALTFKGNQSFTLKMLLAWQFCKVGPGSSYPCIGLYTYIWLILMVNVGKYNLPYTDPMGYKCGELTPINSCFFFTP